MTVVLLSCPPQNLDAPPIGLAYVGTYLRKRGHRVVMHDINAASAHELRSAPFTDSLEIQRRGVWQEDNWYLRPEIVGLLSKTAALVAASKPDWVGFSVMRDNLRCSIVAARMIKSLFTACKIVFGGPEMLLSYFDNRVLLVDDRGARHWLMERRTEFFGPSAGVMYEYEKPKNIVPSAVVDAIIPYEGELSMGALVEADEREGGRCAGVLLGRDEGEFKLMQGPQEADLDALPFPTFEDFPREHYQAPFLPVFTSRGCFRPCTFCSERLLFRYRTRSPGHVIEEMQHHNVRYGVSAFYFTDSVINGSLRTVLGIGEALLRGDCDFQWFGQGIVRKDMRDDMFAMLARSGLKHLSVGLESFSDAMLSGMRKGFVLADALDFFAKAKRAGIGIGINLIVGYPGETDADFRETLAGVVRYADLFENVGSASTFKVNWDSDLFIQHAKYGITLPKRHASAHWFADENTYELRQTRLSALAGVLKGLGKQFFVYP